MFGGAPVVLVACGCFHTLAVTGAGRVYTSGDNAIGQLGLGNRTRSRVFMPVDQGQFEDAHIVMAACGAYHSGIARWRSEAACLIVFTITNGPCSASPPPSVFVYLFMYV